MTTVRLLFCDSGAYHHVDVEVPSEALGRYDRLIDYLREDRDFLEVTHVDTERLCAAYVIPSEA